MRKYFWWFIVIVIVAIVAMVWNCPSSQAQEVYLDVEIIEGHFVMNVDAEGIETEGEYGRVDRYTASFHGPNLRDSTFTHSFAGMAETNIVAETSFPLPCMQWEEEVGVMAGSNTRCFDEAAGSDFTARVIDYNSQAGATETGIGYEVSSLYGEGEIGFDYGQKECARTFNEPAEGEDPVVITEGQSEIKYNSRVTGQWANFNAYVIPAASPPAAMAENGRVFLDLCPEAWR